jgi:hypothetical protein
MGFVGGLLFVRFPSGSLLLLHYSPEGEGLSILTRRIIPQPAWKRKVRDGQVLRRSPR